MSSKTTVDVNILGTSFVPASEVNSAGSSSEATKFDGDKPRLELLSPAALKRTANVMGFGAKKYAAYNWKKGMDWSRLYGAALRHILSHMNGEDIDPESGLSHLDHAACCIMFLQDYEECGLGTDDRYKKEGA